MSAHDEQMTRTTPLQFVAAATVALLPPAIAIFLIVRLVMGIQAGHVDREDPAMSAKAIAARIKPVGEVKIVAGGIARVQKSGEEVFNAVCTGCHTAGAMGAPKFGNKANWAPRIAKGYPTLTKHALGGFNQMPARGGDPDLSDLEVERAIAYMANAAGAKFTPPEPKPAPAKKAVPGAK